MTTPPTMTKLEPGTYVLTADVSNPSPDRRASQDRVSSWNKWVVWPKGTVWIVDHNPEFTTLNRMYVRYGSSSCALVNRKDCGKVYLLVAASLEPLKESASDLLRRKVNGAAGECALEILDLLGVSTATIEEYLKENT